MTKQVKKVTIPENILEAAKDAWRIYADYPCDPLRFQQTVVPVIEAAFGALGDHPIVPTREQIEEMTARVYGIPQSMQFASTELLRLATEYLCEWQCCMCRTPEPEVPEAVKDMLLSEQDPQSNAYFRPDVYNRKIVEAYRRGQQSKGK